MADAKIIITGEDRTKAALDAATRRLNGLRAQADAAAGSFGALGAALGVGAFAAMVKGVFAATAALDDLSERSGASVENLSAIAPIAKQAGTSLDEIADAAVKLEKRLVSGEAAGALEAIGLSAEKLQGLDPVQKIKAIADALALYGNTGEKAVAVEALLGKGAAKLLPFLNDLADSGQLVAKVTTEQAAAAEQLEKNFAALGRNASVGGKAISLELLDPLTRITTALRDAIQAGSGAGGFLQQIGQGLGQVFLFAAKAGAGAVAVIRNIGTDLGALGAIIGAVLRGEFSAVAEIVKARNADIQANTEQAAAFIAKLETRAQGAKTEVKPVVDVSKLKPADDAIKEQIKSAEKLQDALRKAFSEGVKEAEKLRAEADKLRADAAKVRGSAAEAAFDRSLKATDPETAAFERARQVKALSEDARAATAFALDAALQGRAGAAEAQAQRALDLAQQAERAAGKIGDDAEAAAALQNVAEIQAQALEAAAKAKEAQAAEIDARTAAQARLLSDLEAQLDRLRAKAADIPVSFKVLNGPPAVEGFATGGLLSGPGTGTSDSILARLSNGEYVMRAAAVQHYGPGLMDMLNRMALPRFAAGGAVGGTPVHLHLPSGTVAPMTASPDVIAVVRNEITREALKRGRR